MAQICGRRQNDALSDRHQYHITKLYIRVALVLLDSG
jgi:hypothetical protein